MDNRKRVQIALMAVKKRLDYEELYYSDYLYGKEHEVESVWDFVVECRKIGSEAFNAKYKTLLSAGKGGEQP